MVPSINLQVESLGQPTTSDATVCRPRTGPAGRDEAHGPLKELVEGRNQVTPSQGWGPPGWADRLWLSPHGWASQQGPRFEFQLSHLQAVWPEASGSSSRASVFSSMKWALSVAIYILGGCVDQIQRYV